MKENKEVTHFTAAEFLHTLFVNVHHLMFSY